MNYLKLKQTFIFCCLFLLHLLISIASVIMTKEFDIFDFLQEYEKLPCLWDKDISEFKMRTKRDNADEYLLKTFNINTVKELRQKIRSIRFTYNQEISKIKSSITTGSCLDSIYKPKLIWFEFANSFLKKTHQNKNETVTNLILTPKENSTNSELTSQEKYEDSLVNSNELEQNIDITDSIANTVQLTSKNKNKNKNKILMTKSKKSKIDDYLDNAIDALKYVCSKQINENEFDLFGKHVETQLQKLPLEDALNVQNEIQNLLTKARLKAILNIPSLQCPDHSSMSNNDKSMSVLGHTEISSESNQDITYEYVGLDCQPQDEKPDMKLYYNNWSG